MTEVVASGADGAAPSRKVSSGRGADWGGKALLVFALALLMAIPGLFVLALVADRQHRAQSVIDDVSSLQGGAQQLLGPVLVAPYTFVGDNNQPQQAWYVVSPQTGTAAVTVCTESLHRGIFEAPTYEAVADISATFAPPPRSVDLP